MTPNGTAIRAFRKSQKLSLRALASRAEISPGFLSRIERREAGASKETLERLAEGLQVPVAAINREEEP